MTSKNTQALQQIRLRTVLIMAFVVQLVSVVGLVGYFSFRHGQQAVTDLAMQLSRQTSDRVSQQLTSYLETPQKLHEINVQAVDLGILDLHAFDAVGRLFWKQMSISKNLSYLGMGNPNGDFIGVGRDDQGALYTERMRAVDRFVYRRYRLDSQGNLTTLLATDTYRFQEDKWYKSALTTGRLAWSPVYQWPDNPNIVSISLNYPIVDPSGQLIAVMTADLVLTHFNDFLRQLHVSPSGKVFILEPNGLIVASSGQEKPLLDINGKVNRLNVLQSQEPLVRETAHELIARFGGFDKITTYQLLQMRFKHQRVFVSVQPWQDTLGINWLVVVVIPEADFTQQITTNTTHTFELYGITLGVAIAFGIIIARWITYPIEHLTQVVKDITDGRLDQSIHSSHLWELNQLSQAFNVMVSKLNESFATLEEKVRLRTEKLAAANQEISSLNEQLKSDNLRMGAELDVLRRMQQLILPKSDELQIAGLDIAGLMFPADEVGGDYYDVLNTDGIVTIAIGDVTGHGLESGILMLMAQTAVRTLKEIREQDPVRFLSTLNRTIYKNLQRMNSDKNLTLVVMNYTDGKVSIYGQHEEAIVVRQSGQVERIDTIDLGFPIGLDDDIANFINNASVELHPGDGIVLYTDGITEAVNTRYQQYGIARLCEVVANHWHCSALNITEAVVNDVRHYIGTQKVFDDITLLVLKRLHGDA